jgi:hypothetical protein
MSNSENDFIGPGYPYYKNIKTPEQLGMSDKGTMSQLKTDIKGLTQYANLLIDGNSSASATGKPLGNRYFLKSGGKCLAPPDNPKCQYSSSDPASNNCFQDCAADPSGCQQVDRYIYINNIASGNLPFITGNGNFTNFKGLIPGAVEDALTLVESPEGLFTAFTQGSAPACNKITMKTISINNMQGVESNYVTRDEIENMDPCSFTTFLNPLNKQKCNSKDGFQIQSNSYSPIVMSDDPSDKLYFACISIIGIYILYRLMIKSK